MDPQQAGYYAQQPAQFAAASQPQYYQQQTQPQYFDPAAYAYQQAGQANSQAQGYYPHAQASAVDPQQYATQQQMQQPVPGMEGPALPQPQAPLEQQQQQADLLPPQQPPEQPAAPQEPPKRGFFARLFGRGVRMHAVVPSFACTLWHSLQVWPGYCVQQCGHHSSLCIGARTHACMHASA